MMGTFGGFGSLAGGGEDGVDVVGVEGEPPLAREVAAGVGLDVGRAGADGRDVIVSGDVMLSVERTGAEDDA